jgi:tellurium resistance protein TerD
MKKKHGANCASFSIKVRLYIGGRTMFDIPMNEKPALSLGGDITGQNGFGQTQQNSYGQNGFNSQSQNNGFGQTQNNGFGQTQNNGFGQNGYGQNQNSNYGQQTNNYGQTQNNYSQNNYGQNQQNNGFGQTQNNYGQAQQSFTQTRQTIPNTGNNPNVQVQHYEKQSSGGVILKKGAKTKLAGANGAIPTRIRVCLGWDTKGFQTYDLDSSCFMLGPDGKVVGDDWFVFYNQDTSPDGSVHHMGDNTTGAGDGDDEIIAVDLNRVSDQVKKMVFVITIADAIERGYNFSCVSNAFARIVDADTNRELALFNITDYYEGVTAMAVFEVYKHNGEWKINPIGNGLKNTGLIELCQFYGVHVAG